MARHKSLTAQAMEAKREAHVERVCKPSPVLAPFWERRADELLRMATSPDVGPGGEVVRIQSAPNCAGEAPPLELRVKRANIRDTLAEGATRIAEDASIRRTDLLMQPSFNALEMAVDAADSIGAANSLEKMLAHQLALAHEMALRLADRALSYEHSRAGDQVEACRLTNAVARLMGTFQDGLLTLQRLRTGGNQTVTVQHVNVAPGAQAIVGNVRTGGPSGGGGNGK